MITIIYGEPGVGKTALMAKFLIDSMYNQELLLSCKSEIKFLNKHRDLPLTIPRKHISFSNFDVKARIDGRTRESHSLLPETLGLPNDEADTVFLPPFSSIFITEAQRFYPLGDALPEYIKQFYQLHRHMHYDLYLDSQRFKLNLDIRLLATRFIYVLGMRHKYKDGLLKATYWDCIEFKKCQDVDAFNATSTENGIKEGLGKKVTYIYKDNIFKSYDSYNQKNAFYEGMEYRDFDVPAEERRVLSNE